MYSTFIRRLVGAAMLDSATYEEVEADSRALPQAIAVIVLSSVAAGIGARGMAGAREVVGFVVTTTILALLAWTAWAFLMYQIGARLWPGPATQVDRGQLLRTLGFAAAPGLVQVFGMLTPATTPIFALAGIWTLASSVVAVRQALDYDSLARAVAVCAFGWVLALSMAFVFGLVFSPALSGAAV